MRGTGNHLFRDSGPRREDGSAHTTELADFLRRRRADRRPEDLGLPLGARRRVQGMRREEVASRAGMSVNYYTRLEQGRGPQPSPAMLEAISRALGLSTEEREYLFRVAGHAPPERILDCAAVAPGLLRVFDRFEDTPAIVFTYLMETLVANEAAVALLGDQTRWSGMDRFEVYRWFLHPGARDRYPREDHDRQGRAAVANLRVAYGRMGPASEAGELARTLQVRSAEFAELWQRHEVGQRFKDHKTLLHPDVGPIELDCQALFTEEGHQILMILTAEPDSVASAKLDVLRATARSSDPDSKRLFRSPGEPVALSTPAR